MRLRLVPALGQSSTSTARLNASHGPWNSQTNSAITHQLQALRRLERAERRAQADIDREHAADIIQPIICIRWMYRPAPAKPPKVVNTIQ